MSKTSVKNLGIFLFSFSVLTSCRSQIDKKVSDVVVYGDTAISITSSTLSYTGSNVAFSLDSIVFELNDFNKSDKVIFSNQGSKLIVATSKSENAYLIDLNSNKIVDKYLLRYLPLGYIADNNASCNCPSDLSFDIQSLDLYQDSNLIIQTEKYIRITTPDGVVMDSIMLNNISKNRNWISNVYDVPVTYIKQTNKIYIFQYCYKCYERSSQYYKENIIVSIDLHSKKFEEELIKYPMIFQDFNLGYLNEVYQSDNNNNQLYTFMADHRIYIYDSETKKMEIKDGASRFSRNLINIVPKKYSKDEDFLLKHLMTSDSYRRIVFDPIGQKYYRLFSTPRKTSNGVKLDFYIQIFANNFTLISEINIPKINSTFYFAFANKLYWGVIKDKQFILYNYQIQLPG